MSRLWIVAAVALVAMSCSSAAAAPSNEESDAVTTEPTSTTATSATDAPAPTDGIPSSTEPESIESSTTSTTTTEPDPCSAWITIDDTEIGRWFVVNDDVMGGRSLGGLLIENGELRFTGSVNTDGGGFSSIRRGVDPGDLDGWSGVRITAVGDGRTYQFRARDSAEGRNSRVTHRAEITLGPGPTVVEVAFADMRPGVFGRDVDDTALVTAAIDWIGVMIADGVDGEFAATITSIERCR